MSDPPVFAGALHASAADALPVEATRPSGAPGTVKTCGVTGPLGIENGLHPLALQACTANATATPLVNPLMVAALGAMPFEAGFTVKSGIPEAAPLASRVRTTKFEMDWPFGVGIQFTLAEPAVAMADTFTGVAGGAAAGACGFTCQMAAAPLIVPCVQSEPT